MTGSEPPGIGPDCGTTVAQDSRHPRWRVSLWQYCRGTRIGAQCNPTTGASPQRTVRPGAPVLVDGSFLGERLSGAPRPRGQERLHRSESNGGNEEQRGASRRQARATETASLSH
jgi:hypothetical protein